MKIRHRSFKLFIAAAVLGTSTWAACVAEAQSFNLSDSGTTATTMPEPVSVMAGESIVSDSYTTSAEVYPPVGSDYSQAQPQYVETSSAYTPSGNRYSSAVDTMYEENSKRPLGGFFAKGFTRTFTLMGGWNEVGGGSSGLALSAPEESLFSQITDSETGYAISGAMGRRHSRKLRSEIEFAIRENDADTSIALGFLPVNIDATASAYSLMKNVIFEFDNATRITPYGGVGIGISYIDVDVMATSIIGTDSVEDDTTAFTWQAIGGVAARINKATDFVIEYRYFATSELEFDTLGATDSYQANNLFMGVKFEY